MYHVVKSCGCLSQNPVKHNVWFNGCGELSARRWKNITSNANKRSKQLSINIKQAWDLFIKQNRKCALSGKELYFGKITTASLDRIDSNYGYTIDNIQWIHKHINSMKWDLPLEYFIYLCSIIVNPIKVLFPYNSTIITDKHYHSKAVGNITGHLWARYKCAANKRRLPFNITIDEAWDLFIKQKGACALTGLEIVLPNSGNTKEEANSTASLDRIDSNYGYTIDNVQWVHKHINNKIKRELGEPTVVEWCNNVIIYQHHHQLLNLQYSQFSHFSI